MCYYRDGRYCMNEEVIEGKIECPYAKRHPDEPKLVFCKKEDFNEEELDVCGNCIHYDNGRCDLKGYHVYEDERACEYFEPIE